MEDLKNPILNPFFVSSFFSPALQEEARRKKERHKDKMGHVASILKNGKKFVAGDWR
jgi:hypothetical protein